MQIEYRNSKIKKICTNAYEAEKKHGKEMAEKIQLRIDQISAALSVEMMIQYKIGRCHSLKGNRKEQYAVDLVHPYRLVFEKKGNEIQIANIMEIVDYH
ncbi:MAG: type II toxin-antitoxin system RelE/ParE family toxin [Lachnospiraceae bacterium]|nr:type II toxin-antitoxin system RelE/ParE family toxin [Lachnospiraceae bacterium]